MRKIKAGRSASPEERAYAQQLVERFRNRDETDNPNMLLFALERMARTGYLRPIESAEHGRVLMAKVVYSTTPGTYEDKIEAVQKHTMSSPSTAARLLDHKK